MEEGNHLPPGQAEEVVGQPMLVEPGEEGTTCFVCCMRFPTSRMCRQHQHHVHMRWVSKETPDYSQEEMPELCNGNSQDNEILESEILRDTDSSQLVHTTAGSEEEDTIWPADHQHAGGDGLQDGQHQSLIDTANKQAPGSESLDSQQALITESVTNQSPVNIETLTDEQSVSMDNTVDQQQMDNESSVSQQTLSTEIIDQQAVNRENVVDQKSSTSDSIIDKHPVINPDDHSNTIIEKEDAGDATSKPINDKLITIQDLPTDRELAELGFPAKVGYYCHQCDAVIKSYPLYYMHMHNVHKLEKRFQCIVSECMILRHLQEHMYSPEHTIIYIITQEKYNRCEPRNYRCKVCHNWFGLFATFVKHMETESHQYQCMHCGLLFVQPGPRRNHIQSVHPEMSNVCEICGVRMSHSQALWSHLSLHSIVHECHKCQRRFLQREQLVAHMEVHA
ncbi:zinc finger protein 287-like, partial [Limulus polyphemus]|uniref:Zinc finger protein 287-like n=1 Tax=Limulus polyphemus TaxID=6850 RepID=A0ABM1RZ32_LIMPO